MSLSLHERSVVSADTPQISRIFFIFAILMVCEYSFYYLCFVLLQRVYHFEIIDIDIIMSTVVNRVVDLIGNTPMLKLSSYAQKRGLVADIVVKLESFNPLSSAKDRVALSMIEDAKERGLIVDGSVLVEPTSGNTGIGLAYLSAAMGYHLILTMPESMSMERRRILSALGAEIVLTPAAEGMGGAIRRAEQIVAEREGALMLGQFANRANSMAHERTTGPEIWRDTDGKVDIFVAGVGTGGTISGVGRYLKSVSSGVEVVAVEPATSAVLSGESAGAHKIQGIGAGFIPEIYDASVVDRVVKIASEQAFEASRALALEEGLLVGISSGAALSAATELALMEENRGKVIVVLLPDSGERYLSSELFE